MTITYRTAGPWGAGKGANLTPAEVDANFHDLKQAIDTLATNPATPVQIANITVSGSQMTVVMSDGSTFGPFTLPRAISTPPTVETISGATYTLAAADANKYKRVTAACTVTVPPASSVNFPFGTEIHLRQAGAGAITLAAGTGVTLNGVDGFDLATEKHGATITLKKVDADTWDVFGLLKASV